MLILKNFEKLPLESVASGCLLQGLSGRYPFLDGLLDCCFAFTVRSCVLFGLGLSGVFCLVLVGLFCSVCLHWCVFCFFLSLLRVSNFVLALLLHLHSHLPVFSLHRNGRNSNKA